MANAVEIAAKTVANAIAPAAAATAINVGFCPDKFLKYANILIDNIEGGYYNPDWHYKAAMGISGETMFGMDRKAGAGLFTDGVGKSFWDLIDKNKSKDKWYHGYKAADLTIANTLRHQAASIMYSQFDKLANKYLGAANRKIVESDDCLSLHFYYACWNGSGRFQQFAKAINDEIKRQNGKTDLNMLRAVALNSRINSGNNLIKRGGEIMEKLWKSKFGVTVTKSALETAKKNSISYAWLWITLGSVVIGGGVGLYLYKRRKAS